MDGGAWWATVHGVTKSRTQLSDFTFTFHFHALEKEMATQYSCLENPRDGGAWWAAVYGVAQRQTRLKRLSSSSSAHKTEMFFLLLICLLEVPSANLCHLTLAGVEGHPMWRALLRRRT